MRKRSKTEGGEPAPSSSLIDKLTHEDGMGWSNWLVYLLFIAAGAAGFYAVGTCSLATYRCAETYLCWVETPCVVEHVEVDEHGSGGRGGQKYQISILYHYEVGGQSYSGQRYSWWKGNLSGSQMQQRRQELLSSSATHCYINPEAPQESVFDARMLWIPAFVGFVAGGMFALLGSLVALSAVLELWKLVREKRTKR